MNKTNLYPENLLPKHILLKASLRGNEYAWRQKNVKETILAAKNLNFATIGGQPQFRIPEGTCEMYWINYDSEEKFEEESWEDFVSRSAEECIKRFDEICDKVNFFDEGKNNFNFIQEKMKKEKIDLNKYLYFVLYFTTEEEYLRNKNT